MGAAAQLVRAGEELASIIVMFGIGSLAGVLLVPYSTYAKYLKWLTPVPVRVRGCGLFCPRALGGHVVPRDVLVPHIETDERLSHRPRGRAWHDHQPLSVFLAGVAGSGRGQKQARGEAGSPPFAG